MIHANRGVHANRGAKDIRPIPFRGARFMWTLNMMARPIAAESGRIAARHSAVAESSKLRSKASAAVQARASPANAAPVCRNGMRRMTCCVETPFVVWNENRRGFTSPIAGGLAAALAAVGAAVFSMIFRKLKSMRDSALLGLTGIASGLLVSGGAALAEGAGEGHAVPGQMGLQRGTTPIAHEMHWFHDQLLLPIITVVCLFVLGLLVWVVLKFNDKANPVPSRTTHNSLLEVAWTIIPVLILVVIAIPSFRLLTRQLVLPDADITMKVTGKQWYWTYEYPQDQGGGFSFDSLLKPQADIKPPEGDIGVFWAAKL